MSYKDDLAMKVATSNEFELVALQYQALSELTQGLEHNIKNAEKDEMEKKLDKIREILSNLMSTLTYDEFSQNTKSLYVYAVKVLSDQAVKMQTDKISHINKIFTELRDAWAKSGTGKSSELNKLVNNSGTYGRNDINLNGSLSDFGKA